MELEKLNSYVSELSNNRHVVELVKLMNPLDVAKIIQKKLDLQPKEAANLFAHFVKKAGLREWAEVGGGRRSISSTKKKSKSIR